MKLFSARQGWHDVFYSQANSAVDVARVILESGITVSSGYGMSGSLKETVFGHYCDGYSYSKDGVDIVELQNRSRKQNDFTTPGQSLKACMDNVNADSGKTVPL